MAIRAVGKATRKPRIQPGANLCRKSELNPEFNSVIVKVMTVSKSIAIKSTVKMVALVEAFI